MMNGPLACSLDATDEFEAFGETTPVSSYPGGIFSQFTLIPLPNHIVSITGWGTDPAYGAYWIVRNSWGTYWGENGYAKVKMGSHNLGIEDACSWATPTKRPREVKSASGDGKIQVAPLFCASQATL